MKQYTVEYRKFGPQKDTYVDIIEADSKAEAKDVTLFLHPDMKEIVQVRRIVRQEKFATKSD